MADSLHELLLPHLTSTTSTTVVTDSTNPTVRSYLDRLTTLSLSHLTTTEEASITHTSQTNFRSLQALSKRSHGSITSAADHLNNLPNLFESLRDQSKSIQNSMTSVEASINDFAQKYERSTENELLERRKTAALLNRNTERVGNILELPTLLESTVNSSASSTGAGATVSAGAGLSGYASALDIHAHVRRLKSLYPQSDLVAGVSDQADSEISNMITVLIATLQSPALKLAVAMRTIGWLRRVAPDLSKVSAVGTPGQGYGQSNISLTNVNDEGALGSLFLVCRLATLRRTLEALEPLRQLAEQESTSRQSLARQKTPERWSGGVQSERYLKRFIEIFREQSFAIVSMYRSIFPTALPVPGSSPADRRETGLDISKANGQQLHEASIFDARASALATFVPDLVEMLLHNLRQFLPNVSERSSRDSLLSQVLFCAGSLGRLGADFGLFLALLEEDLQDVAELAGEPEWVDAMKKHRVQASRLEVLASGVGAGRKGSAPSVDSRPQSPSLAAR
ncbi:Dor1-like family-domain-containing protein [Elsinoe ampelina]|uniref:Conserved oligomeric Golgi complex subunit 8 n=1 Tax=Elsinoe ampelina TaxID=302913 RepID=A0A6A6GPB4_9PEZI|nr:Dor1-like family-domain-containing protein [Elsinoe ampelina]